MIGNKPSIYNAQSVYNQGGGGGGGGGGLPEGYVLIGNKPYRTVQVGSQLWLGDDLELTWDGLVMNNATSSNDQMMAHPPMNQQYMGGQGLHYNWRAAKYIDDHRSELCPGWRVPSRTDMVNLKNFISSDGKKLMYLPGNWQDGTTLTASSNETLMGIRASGYYDSIIQDMQQRYFWWTREAYPETNRAYGWEMNTNGVMSETYYWYRWEFKLRLIAET